MDIFGDDIDTLIDNDLNKNINEYDDIEETNNEDENDDNGNQKGETGDDGSASAPPKTVEPKRRQIKNPQFRLNVERLKSDRGIKAIDEYFADIKYMGKGHERHDLNNVLKRLEHWAHRLYPKFNFDDFIMTTERLGKKKQIQTYLNLYRQDMLEDVVQNRDASDEEGANDAEAISEPIDEIDYLIGQQIEKYKTVTPKTSAHDTTFDSIQSANNVTMPGTPSFHGRNPIETSTPMSGVHPLELPLTPNPPSNSDTKSQLSSDQMAIIAENRRLAQERLKARRLAQSKVDHPVSTIQEIDETDISM